MRVRHTIAAGLAGLLLIQSAAVAQTVSRADILTISHEQGVEILLANLEVGNELRVDLAGGERVEGRLIEKSEDELVVVDRQQRRIVAAADVVSVRAAKKARMTGGKAFRLAAEISFGVVFGAFLAMAAGLR
jgi:hypothetical protein